MPKDNEKTEETEWWLEAERSIGQLNSARVWIVYDRVHEVEDDDGDVHEQNDRRQQSHDMSPLKSNVHDDETQAHGEVQD
jgi:hypothetical protein